ncbi:MAG: InlB B-repeat-containing protein, partial [Bacillota bacterium]
YAKYEINSYDVAFYNIDSEYLEKVSVDYGNSASAIDAPEVTGYTFLYWADIDGNKYDFESTITTELDLYATYLIHTFEVFFYNVYGEQVHSYTINYGENIYEFSTYEASFSWLELNYWMNDEGAKYSFGSACTGDVHLYAKETYIAYTINCQVDAITKYTITAYYGTTVELPVPSKVGYNFSGWSDGNAIYCDTFVVVGDCTIEGIFTAIAYNISITTTDEITAYTSSQTATYGELITIFYEIGAGYSLNSVVAVDSNNKEIDILDNTFWMPISDVFVTITQSDYPYEVNYISSYDNTVYSFYYGNAVTIDALNLEGYLFLGWFIDEDLTSPIPTVAYGEENENTTIYYSVVPAEISINFVADTSEFLITVGYNSTINPADYAPDVVTGMTFVAWYFDEDFSTVGTAFSATKNTTLYAKYEVTNYIITFYYGLNNSDVYTEVVSYGSLPTPPTDIELDLYSFEGWSADIIEVAADANYFAIYSALYINNYYCNGELLGSIIGEINAEPQGDIADIVCEGYTFSHFVCTGIVGNVATYSAVLIADIYSISYVSTTGCTLNGALVACFGDTVIVMCTVLDSYILDAISCDNSGVSITENDGNYCFTMPACDIIIYATTSQNAQMQVIDVVPEDFSISGSSSISTSIATENAVLSLTENTPSTDTLTALSSLLIDNNQALSFVVDLHDSDYNALDFPDTTDLEITVKLPNNLDLTAYDFFVVKVEDISSTILQCDVYSAENQNYASFNITDGGQYVVLYSDKATTSVSSSTITSTSDTIDPLAYFFIGVSVAILVVIVIMLCRKLHNYCVRKTYGPMFK